MVLPNHPTFDDRRDSFQIDLWEVEELSPRVMIRQTNSTSLQEESDLANEAREMAHIWEKALKHWIAWRYNSEVITRKLEKGDLVLQRANIGRPLLGHGKLATNWEGPYKLTDVLGKGAYKLSMISGSEVSRTWNSSNLRRFFI